MGMMLTFDAPRQVGAERYEDTPLKPDGLEPLVGIFSQIGAIALNGIHDGRIRLGETVAVFGLGGLGQIVALLARRSGARVIAVDLHESRLKMARELGTDIVLDAS